jgi:hypothetical protein
VAAAAWSGLRVRLLGLFPVFGVHSYKLPRLLAGCEESVPRLRRRAEYCAKRMECAQLAAAVELRCTHESGSKLRALHTLRAIRLRLRCSVFSALVWLGE